MVSNNVIKKWGYEIWIVNNDLYCGKHLHVLPTKQCSVHYHKNKTETFYVINGALKLEFSTVLDLEFWRDYTPKFVVLNKGQSITLQPMTAHRFSSAFDYPCDFIEFSTHHSDDDSYRIIESK